MTYHPLFYFLLDIDYCIKIMGKASKRNNGSTTTTMTVEVARKNDESKATVAVDNAPPRVIGPVERTLRIITIFIGIPTITGLLGITIAYIGGQSVEWDHDFIFPFLLMMALLLALGQRTNWFNMMPSKQHRSAVVTGASTPTLLLADNEKKKKH